MNDVVNFRKMTEFDRGILYELLTDAYSFDARYKECWDDHTESEFSGDYLYCRMKL